MPDKTTPIFRDIIDPNRPEHRQMLIKSIQDVLDAKLIVYTANPEHPFAQIMRHDTQLFEDLLRSVSDANKGCLMISSSGGDSNAAEKLLIMCRERFTDEFSVIVPDFAKSAATMIALGSDKIFMGYLAELGPIDPQLRTSPIPGQRMTTPARSFIDGLKLIREKIKVDKDPVQMYLPMLSKIQPEVIAICQRAIDDSRTFAEKWLKKYMLKDDPEQAEKVAEMLSTGEEYKSHGKVIDFEEAKNKLKLNVEKIDKNSELWSNIWELYCRSTEHIKRQGPSMAKLFESEFVSLNLNIQLRSITPPPKKAPLPKKGPPPKKGFKTRKKRKKV